MSYNGSGTFVINTAGQPVVSGTVISSTAFNALTADLATGLSTAITKDGQTTPTANIPMGSNKITGLAVGTAATDAANLSQVQSTAAKLVNSVSGADTITGTMSPTLAAYATGQMFYFVAASANTGAVTINIDSLGAKSITRDGTTALAAGDIQSGEVCVIVYDGTQFQLVNGASQSASIVTENLTVNKATVLNESGGDNDTRIEGDTDANLFFVDASTDRIGVGTNSPANKLDVEGAGKFSISTGVGVITNRNAILAASDTAGQLIFQGGSTASATAGLEYARINTTADDATSGSHDGSLNFFTTTNGTSSIKAKLDSPGNLGLGVTPSAWWSSGKVIQVGVGTSVVDTTTQALFGHNWYYDGTNVKYIANGFASYIEQTSGQHRWYTAASGTAGNTITFTQAMTLDASGNLIVGGTSALYAQSGRGLIEVNGTSNAIYGMTVGGASRGYLYHSGTNLQVWNSVNGTLEFGTNNAERARITPGGEWLVGKTTTSLANAGVSIEANGTTAITRSSGTPLIVNRNTDDGTLVSLRQDQNEEGSISVSGNTVSYNAFAGSHWSQLQDGSKPDILRGTVMESINELCVWPDETNERLPKAKISDTVGSKKVYGVFMAWDNDWTTTNDMYVTAVGAFICRVNGSVTVQEGDLLESNGDGTARVQADDIIRSSTIGKVTSTVKTHQYDDGSYCVPTVLYCG